MRPTRVHARIVLHPFAHLLPGARFDSFRVLRDNLILDLRGFLQTSSRIFERNGRLFEKVTGSHIPMSLCFSKVTKLEYSSFFPELENYPPDDESRVIMGMYSWQQPRKENVFYVLFLQDPVAADMKFFAQRVKCQMSNDRIPLSCVRNWSPAPPMPERLIPRPAHLHKRFGGDPITIKVDGQVFHRRLFIGGTDIQPLHRPHVDTVVNLGEIPSRWLKGRDVHPDDRAMHKGEGLKGMSAKEIQEEANWIIDLLKEDRRVLVHCAAGMNRSVTINCAVLILLEGLSAEAALERVREHHPWARPDSHHWLALRWLEKNKKE